MEPTSYIPAFSGCEIYGVLHVKCLHEDLALDNQDWVRPCLAEKSEFLFFLMHEARKQKMELKHI